MSTMLPPLVPKVDAILVLDGDGNRLAGKYYGDFLTKKQQNGTGNKSREELRVLFEQQLHSKIVPFVARPDAAEVVTCQGRTAVFCGGSLPGSAGGAGGTAGTPGGDVRVVHVGPPGESELVLAHLCEGMYDALCRLMGGQTDRNMVLDNLELVFLLIDEHCDGGIILEVSGTKLASAVLLRDDDGSGMDHNGGSNNNNMNGGGGNMSNGGPMMGGGGIQAQGVPAGVQVGDMSLLQAFSQAKDQFFAGMSSRDGM